jgi:hypothetical protein
MADGWTTKPVYSAPSCRHTETAFQIKNISFRDNPLHYLEIYGFCDKCKKHVTFLGAQTGKVVLAPSMTEDGMMLRLPFVCEGDTINI